jgi:hypothetical protein
MTTARTSSEHHARAAGDPDQATRNRHRASKLFEKDHAYAARLVQFAAAIHGVVRSTGTAKMQDQAPSEIHEEDGITAGIVMRPRMHGSGS